MRTRTLFVSLFLLLSQSTSFAADVVGQGWGDTEPAAKREALADISSRISATVRSKVKTKQTVNSTTVGMKKTEAVSLVAENTVEMNSELPILGAEFTASSEGKQVMVKAVLNTSRSLRLYESRLAELHGRLTALKKTLVHAKTGDAQYHITMDMLSLLDEFRKLNTVVVYLGGASQVSGVDESTLQAQLRAATKQVDSLDLAAKLLVAGVDEAGIYIYPPKASRSNEITPFAAAVKDKISANIKASLNPRAAGYIFSGEYAETADGIDITYHLQDNAGIAQKTNTVHLVPQAYSGLETKPKSVDFEKLLDAGVAVSGNLHADISTNLGAHDLLFREGDEVELLVKLSEMGYFYVVGHTAKATEKNSYLLELNEAQGARKFIHFVNADDANKWVSIGKFSVSPPYGVEGLQVYASNKDLISSLPATKQDGATGLYIISSAPTEGIVKTRALVKKFSTSAQTTEAVLMFTTQPR